MRLPSTEVASLFQVAALTDSGALHALRPEWRSLWERTESATPFQSPEWLIPWWDCLAPGELLVLTVRERGTLVGVAPFCVRSDAGSDGRTLVLLGTGVSDYLDILLDTGVAQRGAAAVLEALAARAGAWNTVDLHQLRSGSALLEAPGPEELVEAREPHEPCPVLGLPRSLELLAETVPRARLRELDSLRRRLSRLGRVEVEPATPETLDALLEALFALHRARWSAHAGSGVLEEAAVREFHRRAARGLLGQGVLRLYALRLDGRIIAVLHAMHHRRRVYYYISGFDPEYARLSPGTLVVGHAIEEAVREGAEWFDFLRGREAYKYRWGAVDQPTWRRRMVMEAARWPSRRVSWTAPGSGWSR